MKPKQFCFILLGILGVTLVAAAGGYYLVLGQIKARSAVMSADLAEQSALGKQIDGLTRLKRQYDREIVPILPQMEQALPRDKKQTEILAQLQNIAAQAGLSITSISMPAPVGLPTAVSQTVKAGHVLALPINFQLSGTYEQLQTFTAKVENLNRYTSITNLAINRTDKAKPIVYSVSLNAYILP